MPQNFVKDADAVLDYNIDWSDWLATGDTIIASSWAVDTGLNEDSDSNTTTITTVWVSGGTVGDTYKLVNSIETGDGREDDRTITIRVVEK